MEEKQLYALYLNEENRIYTYSPSEYAPEWMPRVEELPEGDTYDYLYINGEFIYSPLPPEYPIAENDYESGQIFLINDKYYKALTTINQGDNITEQNAVIIDAPTVFNSLISQNEMLLECILEMSELLYE